MGYYTDFTMSVDRVSVVGGAYRYDQNFPPEVEDAIRTEIEKLNVFEGSFVPGESLYANEKWYDSDQDMLLLSSRIPDVLFTLEGNGESGDDRWLVYYMNGRRQSGNLHIVVDAFDMKRLSPPNDEDCFAGKRKYSYEG